MKKESHNLQNQHFNQNNSKHELMKFKLAVEYASDHIIITDSDGSIIYANKAAERITGYSLSEIIGKKAGSKDLWGGQMKKSFYKKLWKTIKFDKRVFKGEVKNRRKNGEDYIAGVNIAPVLNEEGEVIYFVGIERDITQEKEVERMKTEFVSIASHQLRTPLSAIRWALEAILDGDTGSISSEGKSMAEKAYDSTKRMIGLVNNLLNVSRIESGKLIVESVETDIIKAIEMVIEEQKKRIEEKKLSVIFRKARNIPKVKTDPQLFTEVIANLLSNAIKYTPKGGTIHIKVEVEEKTIKCTIKDNGIGIPKAQQKRLFSKFFRADNAIGQDNEGTGLGLYIVRSIVEVLGGLISFTSEENKGTTMWFTIPLSGSKAQKGIKRISRISSLGE